MKSERDTNMKLSTGLSILAISVLYSCKRSYAPPAITAPNNYLVVEGVIAAGQDSTIIKLSRTVNLSGTNTANPELNATVTVQGDQNVSYNLSQVDTTGRYGAPPLNLDNSHKYRLLITTTDGKTYASDYESVKITPPIDTLGYNITGIGLNIYTNAHDPSNNTKYYRWDYSETYIYNSPILTYYKFDETNTDPLKMSVTRTPDELINTCYVTLNSSNVLLNSSAKLTQDVIQNNQITQIPKDSEKILHRYSIIVRQYALTPEAYAFWSILKRNTEQIGTIFDVQPSEVKGNIHCTSNPSEPVVGYISVSSIAQKRIFIDRQDLPLWPYNTASECTIDSICWATRAAFPPDELKLGELIPVGPVKQVGTCNGEITPSYSVREGDATCVDCRLHLHGITKVPVFWTTYGQ
jgi:hypothetical protein